MKLSTIFTQLTHGELSQLNIGGSDGLGIQACDYDKIVSYVNLGLIELYKRFLLKEAEVVVQQYDQIQTYYLEGKYAATSDSNEPIKYIEDSIYQPFMDDVLKIEQVFNELGIPLIENQDGCMSCWSSEGPLHPVYTPSYNSIQVPQPEKENQMIVTYRASHEEILVPGLDPETTEVRIPPGLLEALVLYIGARVYAGMNSDQNAEGNNYYAKFEASCQKYTDLGLVKRDDNTNAKLDCAGWV